MVKIIWKPLEKDHPIFTKSFSTYTPRRSGHVQGATRKIPKWLLGRETLYSPKRKEDKWHLKKHQPKNGGKRDCQAQLGRFHLDIRGLGSRRSCSALLKNQPLFLTLNRQGRKSKHEAGFIPAFKRNVPRGWGMKTVSWFRYSNCRDIKHNAKGDDNVEHI